MLPMDMSLLIKGVSIGFAIAAPVGPIGVLCIRRTIANGTLSGFISGAGAACADSFYGAVAAFGLAVVSGFLLKHRLLITFLGGLYLLFMGARILREKSLAVDDLPAVKKGHHGIRKLSGDFISTLALTLTNPATIVSFVAIFSSIGVLTERGAGYMQPLSMVAGVFIGSLAWWLLLSMGIGYFHHRANKFILRYTHLVSGSLIAGFGVLVLGRVVMEICRGS